MKSVTDELCTRELYNELRAGYPVIDGFNKSQLHVDADRVGVDDQPHIHHLRPANVVLLYMLADEYRHAQSMEEGVSHLRSIRPTISGIV